MKIKLVCELTGLSDRTVRYYIDQGLIAPQYTENYLGRKTFDFSQEDVEQLQHISTLRRYTFSIEEIRSMRLDPASSQAIIQSVKCRVQQTVEQNKDVLEGLSCLEAERDYTVDEAAQQLELVGKSQEPTEETAGGAAHIVRRIFAVIVFAVVWVPLLLCVSLCFLRWNVYLYPVLDYHNLLLCLLAVSPSLLMLILSKCRFRWKTVVRWVLCVLCVVSIPFCSFLPVGIVWESRTTNIDHYLTLDSACLANRDVFLQELFPTWAYYFENEKQPDGSYHTIYLESKYYYRYSSMMDYTYDIYAQWPLSEEVFDKEVTRVETLFADNAPKEQSEYRGMTRMKKGNYTCLIWYETYRGDPLFEKVTDNYRYYIFAFCEDTRTVRYINCVSLENGADQPYYLELEWE